MRGFLLILVVLTILGCAVNAPPAGLIYSGVEANKQFDPGAISEQPGQMVYGEACSHSILGITAWGDASVKAALEKAGADDKTLKNISVDHSLMNIFIFYGEYCTQVTAYVVD